MLFIADIGAPDRCSLWWKGKSREFTLGLICITITRYLLAGSGLGSDSLKVRWRPIINMEGLEFAPKSAPGIRLDLVQRRQVGMKTRKWPRLLTLNTDNGGHLVRVCARRGPAGVTRGMLFQIERVYHEHRDACLAQVQIASGLR